MPFPRLVGSFSIEETRRPAMVHVLRGLRKEYRSLLRGSQKSQTELLTIITFDSQAF